MKKTAIIIAALAAMFIGVGGILPALAQVRDLGAIPGAFVVSYTLGVCLVTMVGASTLFCVIRRRKAA